MCVNTALANPQVDLATCAAADLCLYRGERLHHRGTEIDSAKSFSEIPSEKLRT
jgi:hypothetical protein